MLSDSDRTRVKIQLEVKIEEYEQVLKSDASDNDQLELDQTRVGRLARMDAVQHHAIAQAQHERARKLLTRLKTLLTKIDNPDFGECHYCGDDIPVGRLLVRPESLRCVECAELED